MDFSLSESDLLIADTVTRFAADVLRPKIREFERERGVDDDVRAQFAQLGLDRLHLPESSGGAGLGLVTRALVNRSLAEADAGSALALDRIGPAAYVVEAFEGVDGIQRLLDPIINDTSARVALVVDLDADAPRDGVAVTASYGWATCDHADALICLTRNGGWIAREGFGFDAQRGAALHAAGASAISYAGTPLASWRDADAAARALAKIRVYYASLIWGVLCDAAAFSRAYAQDRTAFGKPIAHHQGLAFLLVDMFTTVERAGLLIEDAARTIDDGASGTAEAAAAFVDAIEASTFVGPNAVQVLGGHGFMRDFPVEKAMRDSRALGLLAGGVNAAREDAGAGFAAVDSERTAA